MCLIIDVCSRRTCGAGGDGTCQHHVNIMSTKGVTVHKSHGLVRTSVFKSRYGTVRFIVKGEI